MVGIKSFFKKKPPVVEKPPSTQNGGGAFYEYWRGANTEYCKIVKQTCPYVKSAVVLNGRLRKNPCCPGCIFMHMAGGAIDLADQMSLEDEFNKEEHDKTKEE